MLKVNDIVTSYGQIEVLHGVSLSVEAKEIVCLLGRNGAGKTTTLRSILGLTPPRTGNVKFRNVEITKRKPFEIGNLGLGYAPDDMRIFPDLTVEENLLIAGRRSRKGKNGWTVQRIYNLFPFLKEARNNKGISLSGGQQKMLAIGRGLMRNPDLLILDEPSEGLAPLIVRELIKTIKEIKGAGISVLIADQNFNFCRRIGDRGYIIDRGLILYEGKMEEIERNEELVRRYLAV